LTPEREYTPDEFVAEIAKPVVEAIHRREPRLLEGTLYTQFAVETGWGSTLGVNPYNYAGISRNGQLLRFPTLGDFVERYVTVIGYPYYARVLEAQSVAAQLQALGESPWSAAHYAAPGEAAGTTLLNVWTENIEPLMAPADQEKGTPEKTDETPAGNDRRDPEPTAPQEPASDREGGDSALVQDVLHDGITPDAAAPTVEDEDRDVALYQTLRIIPTVLQVGKPKSEMQCLYAGLAALKKANATANQMAWYLSQCYAFNSEFAAQLAQSVVQTGTVLGAPLPPVPDTGWDFAKATPEVTIP
jgi:hypothetical protein